jgi:hypothetical protein
MDWSELRKAVEEIELVDGHAHNLVALDSNFPFIHAFSEAQGHALASSQHSLSFKVFSFSTSSSSCTIYLIYATFHCSRTSFLLIFFPMNMKRHIY